MNDRKRKDHQDSRDATPSSIHLARKVRWVGWRKHMWMLMGVALFCVVYFFPPFPDAVDPQGERFELTHEGKAALALFLLAATWWVFELIPIGVTGITIGVVQVLFLIRDPDSATCAKAAFGDFMDPSVWFIIGSITFGMVFSKTGLTKRMAYRMLVMVGERTSMIYLGCFVITAGLTLIMAHTAVAATVFPLLMAIYSLYTDDLHFLRTGLR